MEIVFHSYDALPMVAQTAKGAIALLRSMTNHPEIEIDTVTTPEGCTIAGLNETEHKGFSSAMIKGIATSAEKAEKLYNISFIIQYIHLTTKKGKRKKGRIGLCFIAMPAFLEFREML